MSENENAGATARPWHLQAGFVRVYEQAQQLVSDIGTPMEWTALTLRDHEGDSEIVALCHPDNAAVILDGVNEHAALVRVAEAAKEYVECHTVESGERPSPAALWISLQFALQALSTLRSSVGGKGREGGK